MSVSISIQNAVKRYGDTTVISDLSIDIRDKELFTLLGPSGCGKTTLLRMIAGFNTIEGGDFYFDEIRINDMDASRRNIGMVFQNYAIFPHYTVRQNVEFGLRNRRLPREQISSDADEFLRLMQIYEYRDRMPELLSGGQQQRVALARALVIKPDVLLMDEPLSNLDAKLRMEMRQVIRDIQKEVGITTVYVTHDQEEAMAISDRIAVMQDGVIQHVGSPREIYHRPSNVFVATFIGRTNLIEGDYDAAERRIRIPGGTVTMDNLTLTEKASVILSVRPEDINLSREQTPESLPGVVTDEIFLGLNTHFLVKIESGQILEIIHESVMDQTVRTGDTVYLTIRTRKINVFSGDGSRNLISTTPAAAPADGR